MAFEYDAPPAGETRFDSRGRAYKRRYDECVLCGHWFSRHDMDLSALYGGEYVDATYGGTTGMQRAFERIVALPPGRSDNTHRVRRILDFVAARQAKDRGGALTVLDVGSGLGVFPYAMARAGCSVTAIDPDARACKHLRDVVGVRALQGDFRTVAASLADRFDLISFNKVIEHVERPAELLACARALLRRGGHIYVEVPDAPGAASSGPDREEFFIEHHHVFTAVSLTLLAKHGGYEVDHLERLREPSGKFTLCAFLTASV